MNDDETQIEDFNESNASLLAAWQDSADGHHKSSSASATNMIRRRIREESVVRRVLPLQTKTEKDLEMDLKHDQPVIREHFEAGSMGAYSVPLGETYDSEFYFGDKFEVIFNTIQSRELRKSIFELMTYKNLDLRRVTTDNVMRDVHTEEDSAFFTGLYDMVGPVGGIGASGYPQHFEIEGGITRDSYKEVLSVVEDFNLNNGTIIMNRRTAKAFLGWGRDELGGDLTEKLTKGGLAALEDNILFGVRHIFTIKRDMVPDGRVIVLTEPGYLGRYYQLKPLTAYVERRKNYITVSADQVVGLTIANVAGACVVDFTNV